MRTAACYTNRVRIVAYAKNKKVNYPGGVAKNWETLQATLPCSPDFTVQTYVGVPIYCSQTNACAIAIPVVQPPSSTIYSGGGAGTESTTILSGGGAGTSSSIYSGGGGGTESSTIVSGGSGDTQSSTILSGGSS
jgi:hypothetical protein